MSGAAVVLLAWAFLHVVLVGILLGWTRDPLQVGLMAGSGGAVALLALALLAYRHDFRLRLVPDLSLASVLLAFGVAAALVGTAFGLWLVLLGGGAAALGLAGWARELRAERGARE